MKAESPALSFYSCPIAGIKRLRRHRFYTSLKGRVRDMKELVRLEGITKAYGDHVIIPPLSLSIHDGEFLTLLGPSGCGKTTLLRMLAGLDTPTKGKIILDGQDITNLPPYKRDVNMVFQNYALFPHMTAEENIGFGLRMKGVGREEAAKRTQKLLKLIQLEDLRSRYPSQMSGGQQQRVAVARALVNNPKMLLLDEPLGALDYQLRKTLQIELKDLQEELGLTFVFVTHDQEEALTISDTIVVMNQGYIQQIGTPEMIYNEPVNAFVADFIGEANILNGIMLDDCRIQILGKELECVDKGFGKNTPVDVVIRPEDIEVTAPEDGQLVGIVENTTFKGVHYEMSVRCGKCEILIHSTKSAEIGSKIGMRVIPFNIQIMNKLLPFYDNVIEATVTYANQNDNSFEFELEGETVTVPDKYYEEGTKLKIALPPDALSLAGDGVGDLKDLYIESVVYKGEQNEIILESDERKWLMLSDTDEQVATYVPLSFDFSKARFEVISEFSEKEG